MSSQGHRKGRSLKKVLIAGGAGFIGQPLATALVSSGAEVHIIDNHSRHERDDTLAPLLAGGHARFDEIDLLNPSAIDSLNVDYTIIINLAAILGVESVLRRPYQTLRDNVLMQEALIRLGKRQKSLQRFLFTSSSEVYAGSLVNMDMPIPTPENFPLCLTALNEPRTSYMLSKICGEAMLHYSGLPFTIVRPHNIYGPRMGMSHVIPQLFAKAFKASPSSAIEVFSPDHRRCFCYIDDAIEMLMGVLETSSTCGEVLNLGADSPEITMKELGEMIIAIVGKELSIKRGSVTAGSPARRAPAMTRMVEATGRVARTPLQEGLRRTYEWYRRQWSSELQSQAV
jgi:UDP-glucose 4-epimerase